MLQRFLPRVAPTLRKAAVLPRPQRTLLRASSSYSQTPDMWTNPREYDALQPRVSVLAQIQDVPGSLHNLLRYFWKYDVNLTRIESRPSKRPGAFEIYMDFHGQIGERPTDLVLDQVRKQAIDLLILDEREVPWFPRHINDLDVVANRVLDAGIDLQSDHPGFKDEVYRKRRGELAQIAIDYRQGHPIPRIDYTEDEVRTWGEVYQKQKALLDKFACSEYKSILSLMEQHCGYSATNIPQQQDISDFLMRRTGFRLRPVAGLLSSRDFLNGLAFRVFFSTQYIRHHSVPLYTPEPDICHELLGHAPMFADPDFAEFSQEIGLASLGASDDDIKKLATCYWFSVEFGLLKENGALKAYGAGTLSSYGELEYSCAPYRPAGGTDDTPEYRPWDPYKACKQEYPITTYQPIYYVAESLSDAKDKMRDFCESLARPFRARYNPLTQSIWVDRAVKVPKNPGPAKPDYP